MPANESVSRLIIGVVTGIGAALTPGCIGDPSWPQIDCEEGPGELFERRIAPLLESDRPSSCGACHSTGVELASFVRRDPCEAMACLKAEGLVDLHTPELSVLLTWLGRTEPESELITPRVQDEERRGFLEWISHESACGGCQGVECPDRAVESCRSATGDDSAFDSQTDPGDCSAGTLERLFRGTVYAERLRCSPCHRESADLSVAEAPRFLADVGSCQVASLSTMNRMIHAGYFDLREPESSLALLKPLPESQGGVKHGGHDKFAGPGETAYEEFLHFAQRYATCSSSLARE